MNDQAAPPGLPKRSTTLLAAALTGVLALSLSCARSDSEDPNPTFMVRPAKVPPREAGILEVSRPGANLVLILIDTLRTDHLPCYGYSRATAPALCAFGEENIFFENMFSNAPSTKPAIATLFTSLYPSQHKSIYNEQILGDDLLTLAEILAMAGYTNVAINDNNSIKHKFNYHQGFDVWEDTANTDAAAVNEKVFEILGPLEERPFFAYIHYMEPHSPYYAPPPFDRHFNPDYEGTETGLINDKGEKTDEATVRFQEDPERLEALIDFYDNEIAFLDHKIMQLFAFLKERGMWEETVVLVVTDHGEGFLEHGYLKHSRGLYSDLIRVPFMLRIPGFMGPLRVKAHVQTLDILPTVLDVLGLERQEMFMGQSVFDLVDQPNRPILSEHLRTGRGAQRSLILDQHKLLKDIGDSHEAFLYDMRADPQETTDLLAEGSEARPLARSLDATLDTMVRSAIALASGISAQETDLDPQTRKELRALGYIE